MSISETDLINGLRRSDIEYVAYSNLGGTREQICFIGDFEGRTIVWNATLIAMGKPDVSRHYQYIQIEQTDTRTQMGYIEIGLLVTCIDEPTVLKAMKMIRQYRNLRAGRHEFKATNK